MILFEKLMLAMILHGVGGVGGLSSQRVVDILAGERHVLARLHEGGGLLVRGHLVHVGIYLLDACILLGAQQTLQGVGLGLDEVVVVEFLHGSGGLIESEQVVVGALDGNVGTRRVPAGCRIGRQWTPLRARVLDEVVRRQIATKQRRHEKAEAVYSD
jgi:hypothetical protein